MNYRLLPLMFIISASVCLLSAKTNALETSQNNYISQQDSVIAIDVQSTVNDSTFFKSLIKDLGSDRVEYKDGKIFIYITPPILPVIIMAIIGMFGLSLSTVFFAAMCQPHGYHTDSSPYAALFVVFAFLTACALYISYIQYIDLYVEKNPLLIIGKKGITYKNGPLISWGDIDNILQSKVSIYTNGIHIRTDRTLTCMGTFGEELFEMSENCWKSPITYDQMIKLINKAIHHMKQKQASLTS